LVRGYSFLLARAETASRYHLHVYVWTLMTTHYHLLLCTPRANLSREDEQVQPLDNQLYVRLNIQLYLFVRLAG